jgi:hypothetical protein
VVVGKDKDNAPSAHLQISLDAVGFLCVCARNSTDDVRRVALRRWNSTVFHDNVASLFTDPKSRQASDDTTKACNKGREHKDSASSEKRGLI